MHVWSDYDLWRTRGPVGVEIDEDPGCGNCFGTAVSVVIDPKFGPEVVCADCGTIDNQAYSDHFVFTPQTDGELSGEVADWG